MESVGTWHIYEMEMWDEDYNINSLPTVVDTSASDADLGTYTGLYYIASQLAAVAGPTINGYIVEWGGGDYNLIFVVTPALFRAGDPVYAGGDTGRGKTSRCGLVNADDPRF
jgi:hypothetical protein